MFALFLGAYPKDSAKKIVGLTRTIEAESPGSLRGIKLLSGLNLGHAEAQLHNLVRDWGLTLDIKISFVRKSLVIIPVLRVTSCFEFLFCKKPEALLGGFSASDESLGQHLASFWRSYKEQDGNHDVYHRHGAHLHACIPFFLYADEGRGHRKSPVQIWAMESCFGLLSRRDNRTGVQHSARSFLDTQTHTEKGHSFNSHFLIAVMGHTMYKNKAGKEVWHRVVEEISMGCIEVFEDGVVEPITRKRFYGVCLGMKGDSPALAKIGRLTRTFQNLGNPAGMCPYCLGGTPDHPWEDVSPSAAWRRTLFNLEPWRHDALSSLRAVCCDQMRAANFYKGDPFHIWKYGIGRHFVGSCLVTLAQWGFWPGREQGFDDLMHRAYADFKWSCKHEMRATPHLKSFTRQLLHFANNAAFPWFGCKGGDTMLLARWLLRVLRHGVKLEDSDERPNVTLKSVASDEQKLIFDAMHDGCRASLLFFRLIHEDPLWRNRQDCQKIVDCVNEFSGSMFVFGTLQQWPGSAAGAAALKLKSDSMSILEKFGQTFRKT